MKASQRIRLYGLILAILAAVGFLLTSFDYLAQVFFVLVSEDNMSRLTIGLDRITFSALAGSETGRIIGMVALMLAATGSLLPWIALLALGKALQKHAPISVGITQAFRRLALAFVAFALLRGMAATVMLIAAGMPDERLSLTINNTGLLVGAIAALAAYCVSQILQQGIVLAEENQGFV